MIQLRLIEPRSGSVVESSRRKNHAAQAAKTDTPMPSDTIVHKFTRSSYVESGSDLRAG